MLHLSIYLIDVGRSRFEDVLANCILGSKEVKVSYCSIFGPEGQVLYTKKKGD